MSILEMSGSAAVLIAAILLLRRAALYRLPKWTFLALWGVALCRLLIPFSISSPFSVYTGVELVWQSVQAEQGPDSPEADRAADPAPAWEMPAVYGGSPGPAAYAYTGDAAASPGEGTAAAAPVSPLAVVYCLGAGLCGLCFGVAYWRCRRAFGTARPVERDLIVRWREAHPMHPPIQVRQSGAVKAPLTYGLFRPVILLPAGTDWEDREQLRYVLAHEYIHILRRDAWWKLLLVLAVCLHWFNPFVWAMYIFANRDIELSCDEAVVRRFGAPNRSAYALSLIRAEEEKRRFMPLCSSYRKSTMEERITAIMKMKKRSLGALAAALALVAAVTVAFVTSAQPRENFAPPAGQEDTQADGQEETKPGPAQLPDETLPASAPAAMPEPDAVRPAAEQQAAAPVQNTQTDTPAASDCVNSLGHTYGAWTADDGYEDVPDLIYVRLDQENGGYLKREEIYPYADPISAQGDMDRYLQWYHTITDGEGSDVISRHLEIPLYDQEENQIGYCYDMCLVGEKLSDAELLDRVDQGDPVRPILWLGTAGPEHIPAGRRVHGSGVITEHDETLIKTYLVQGDWPRNSEGKTYGSTALSGIVGYDPDLIAVTTTGGDSGYVRYEDMKLFTLHPEWLDLQPDYYEIPVYSLEGENIGRFGIGNPSKRNTVDQEKLKELTALVLADRGWTEEEIIWALSAENYSELMSSW